MATSFKQQIKEALQGQDRKLVAHFAWRCAIKALPLLAKNGEITCWKEDEQKHLYAVLNALDYAAADANAAAAYAAAYDAAVANTAAAYAANAAANEAANAYAAAYEASRRKNIEQDLLKEAKNIKAYLNTPINKALYGKGWQGFLWALRNMDCAYWANVYTPIFKDGYIKDTDELTRRLNISEGIQEQGAAGVGYYLLKLQQGATRNNEARIIILGDKGAGKTSLTKKLLNPKAKLNPEEPSTPGVDRHVWEIKQKGEEPNLNVNIWDFGGHTVIQAVHKLFLSERCLYIMVVDGRTEKTEKLYDWLNQVKNNGGDSKVIILVNKRDQHKVNIPINNLRAKYQIHGDVQFVNINDVEAVTGFRKLIERYIVDNPSWAAQQLPESYFNVKEALQAKFQKLESNNKEELITREVFSEIAKKQGIEDLDLLLKNLNHLGISLWYKDLEHFNTLVLNPEWISNGIYTIINWANNKDISAVKYSDCETVFKDSGNRYSIHNQRFLCKLMEYKELAYETKDEKELIIPHLLAEDRLTNLPIFPIDESLMLRFQTTEKLPLNLISRLIVRHKEQVKIENQQPQYWRYGVILKDNKGSLAQVVEDERTIDVWVKGKDKTAFLDTIRNSLTDIFKDHKSEQPIRYYLITPFGKFDRALLKKENEIWIEEMQIVHLASNNEKLSHFRSLEKIAMEPYAKMFGLFIQTFIEAKNPLLKIEQTMGDTYNVNKSQGPVGPNGKIENSTFQQNNYEFPENYNYEALAEELAKLKDTLIATATNDEHQIEIAEAIKAANAAKNKDGKEVTKHLKNFGEWAKNTTTKLGVKHAKEILAALSVAEI